MANLYLNQLLSDLADRLPDHPLEKDVAATRVLGCAATLMRMRKAGRGPPHVSHGIRRFYYPKAALLEWIRVNCTRSMGGDVAEVSEQ